MGVAEALRRLSTLGTRVPAEVRAELDAVAAELDADAATVDRPGLGRFEDLGPLGEGGMGIVRRVRDPRLGRTVALKTVAEVRDAALDERFLEEARITAQLQHPAIPPVHELGTLPDGRAWFTMREVRGRTLHEVVASGEWPLRRLLDALLRVAEAVAYAHARGVVHRDLKPSNVMIGDFGEVFVLDWGIAKVVGARDAPASLRDERGLETRYGAVMGTPVFMAPEQAAGDPDAIGPATDVWGLGAVLHHLLTGRPPLTGDDFEVAARLLDPDLRIVRSPGPEPVDDALWDLCERALRRDPADRMADAGVFADELRRHLEGERSRERALDRVREAARRWPEADELRARAEALRAEAREALAKVPRWAPEAERHAAWATEDRARELEQRAALADLEAEQGMGAALAEVPHLPEAHAALAGRYRRVAMAASARREVDARAEALLRRHAEALPTRHPDRESHLAWLRGEATLSARASPDTALVLEREEERDRRRVPVEVAAGRGALEPRIVPAGSWRVRARAAGGPEVLVPLLLGRGERCEAVVEPPAAIPEGTVYVAPGWFLAGGDANRPRRRLWCDGFVVGRFPVTMGEYLAFLNDLWATGRRDEALRHAPQVPLARHGEGPLLLPREEDGRFRLGPDPDGDELTADLPAMCVDWLGAVAYAAWLRARTGLPWRLPGDLEWEKAARGVDGRTCPWGDQPDPSRCNTRDSHEVRSMPVPVDTFPLDVSPFGMRGAAGNVRDWTGDAWRDGWSPLDGDRVVPPPPDPPLPSRVVGRGGAWPLGPAGCTAMTRVEDRPDYRHPGLGFRLACPWP